MLLGPVPSAIDQIVVRGIAEIDFAACGWIELDRAQGTWRGCCRFGWVGEGTFGIVVGNDRVFDALRDWLIPMLMGTPIVLVPYTTLLEPAPVVQDEGAALVIA